MLLFEWSLKKLSSGLCWESGIRTEICLSIWNMSTCSFSIPTLMDQESVPALPFTSSLTIYLVESIFQYSSKELGDGYFNIVHSSGDVLGIHCEQLCVLWHCYVFLRLLEVKGTTENTFGCISKLFAVSKISFCNCVEPLPRPLFLNNLALWHHKHIGRLAELGTDVDGQCQVVLQSQDYSCQAFSGNTFTQSTLQQGCSCLKNVYNLPHSAVYPNIREWFLVTAFMWAIQYNFFKAFSGNTFTQSNLQQGCRCLKNVYNLPHIAVYPNISEWFLVTAFIWAIQYNFSKAFSGNTFTQSNLQPGCRCLKNVYNLPHIAVYPNISEWFFVTAFIWAIQYNFSKACIAAIEQSICPDKVVVWF